MPRRREVEWREIGEDDGGRAARLIECPFTVLVDSREQTPYRFLGLPVDGKKGCVLRVPIRRATLETGDYGIDGMPLVTVERKSLEDLFASVVRRENFEARLHRMATQFEVAAVVVEAEISSILYSPPRFSKYPPKSLLRTILAWTQRFPAVHWHFLPDREHAEAWTFRLLQRYHKDRTPARAKKHAAAVRPRPTQALPGGGV